MKASEVPENSLKGMVGKSDFEYIQDRDTKINRETTPEPDEQIRIPSIWVLEAFPPSFIRNVRISSERLGWNKEECRMNPDFMDKVERMRSRFGGGGWLNLGYIVSDSTEKGLLRPRTAPLPEGVKLIRSSIIQFIPSITIFLGQFFFDEDGAKSLEEPLNRIYTTNMEPIKGGGYSIIEVERQKKDATDEIRNNMRKLCSNWVREYMPGLFSSGILGDYYPTCELILLSKNNPFIKIGDMPQKSFLGMMGLDSTCTYDVWKSEGLKGAYLKFIKEAGDYNGRIVISGNVNGMLTDEKLNMYGADTREDKIVNYLHDLDYTLGIWALSRTARAYEKKISMIRDEYGGMDETNIEKSIRKIYEIDRQFLRLQADAIPFAGNLASLGEHKYSLLHNVYEFTPLIKERGENTKLFRCTIDNLIEDAGSIISNENQVRAIAERSSQIIYSISSNELTKTNIKLQKRISWMTLWILALTIVMAISGLSGNQYLRDIFTNIIKDP